ncbi:sigma-54 interaction domain-containing protein [Cognatitamlana onchidii]|uniref:sigma-54 interaction domain-containing protein n=1 Tax=Cognatitamlana onchidii TaxID=2562860 RepID=UPI0010A5F28D|nr:sigma-54 dependent transcriptional regulator [Algibacter onchidii]
MLSDYIFIFFAGIAITTGISYLWLGIVKHNSKSPLFFGLFAIFSGAYFILRTLDIKHFELFLFVAVGMFVLFPWYFNYECNYRKKTLPWTVTALGVLYYITVQFHIRFDWFRLEYIFSYSAYAVTIYCCYVALKHLYNTTNKLQLPLLLATIYYTIFVLEEIAYNYFGAILPWRQLFSFTYLDLFPVFIIGTQLVILVSHDLEKSKLEKSIKFYKNNLNRILDQTNTMVVSVNLNGEILYTNTFFKNLFLTHNTQKATNLKMLISSGAINTFETQVFNEENITGNIISKFKQNNKEMSIAWSFVKVKASHTSKANSYIYLFGHDITALAETEESLRIANRDLEILKNKLQQENIQLKNESALYHDSNTLIGKSPNFNYVINRIDDAAPLNVPVLLEGETGVGKELFANEIHKKSLRHGQPFVKVNCAAIPKDLLESELFGYEKGAFTGADKLKRGLFELADKGTLFLDEFGELPLSLQPKLLRALQEGEIQRLGAEKGITIDTRIIAATNVSLATMVQSGEFRSDLYYRINVFPITIPPLRNRATDIPLLIQFFIAAFNNKYNRHVKEVSQNLMDDLTNHKWPGNVRQLKNVIERAVITTNGPVLKLAEALPANDNLNIEGRKSPKSIGKLSLTLADYERNYIVKVLEQCNGQISGKNGAASILDLPASTLRSKMKKLNISR